MEENFDNKLKSECNEIKEQINPPQELINRTILKVREVEQERRYRGKKSTLLLSKIVAMFVTAVVLVEGATFAFKKQDILSLLFSNVDKGIETAIDYENMKNVDMDYIEISGIKFKVEFVLMNKSDFDIIFKFDGIEEYKKANGINEGLDNIYINELKIYDDKNNNILDFSKYVSNIWKNIDGYYYYIVHASSLNDGYNIDINQMKVDFKGILLESKNYEKDIEVDSLNIDIGINNINIDDKNIEYNIISKNKELIEDYDIKLTQTNLKIKLKFEYSQENLNKDTIVLKDNKGRKYKINDNYVIDERNVNVVFPVGTYLNLEESKELNLQLGNQKYKLKLKNI